MKKRVITLVAVVVIVGVIASGYYLFMKKSGNNSNNEQIQLKKQEDNSVNDQKISDKEITTEYSNDIKKLGDLFTINGKQITGKDLAKVPVYNISINMNIISENKDCEYVAIKLTSLLKGFDNYEKITFTADDDYQIIIKKEEVDSNVYIALFQQDNLKLEKRLFSTKFVSSKWIANIKTIVVE